MVVVLPRPSGSTKRAPANGKPERAGRIKPESFGFRLGRGTNTTVAEILDLVPDARRQNDSVQP